MSGFVFGISCFAQKDDYNAMVNSYIQKYKDIAIREMKEYRVPASITLAQGILESNAGRSVLAVEANNHFGIKCHKEWTGMTFYKDDETKNECFRKYGDPLESFRDHSWFLTKRDRYKDLFLLDMRDYKGWANGLKSAGYATNPAYAQLLIKTIETFLLDRYDKAEPPDTPIVSVDVPVIPEQQTWSRKFAVVGKGGGNRTIYMNNRSRMIISTQDDDLYLIARDLNVSVGHLLEFNDLTKATALTPGQIVYLEPKRRKGPVKRHTIQDGETIYSISQLYGMKISMLLKRNDLGEGVEPKTGTILRLR